MEAVLQLLVGQLAALRQLVPEGAILEGQDFRGIRLRGWSYLCLGFGFQG